MKKIMKIWALLIVAALSLTTASTVLAGGGNGGNTMVIPPQAHPYGQTYGEWSAAWWQWAFSLPVDQNPWFDSTGCENGANGQSGPVWFLTGVINVTGTAVRECTIPAGKALFFPIVNSECATLEGNGTTLEALKSCADGFKTGIIPGAAFCEIDGVAIQNIDMYFTETGLYTYGPLPENNVLAFFGFDAPAGVTSLSYGEGYYLMVKPLKAGQHTIHFGGGFSGNPPFLLDITYLLTVE